MATAMIMAIVEAAKYVSKGGICSGVCVGTGVAAAGAGPTDTAVVDIELP